MNEELLPSLRTLERQCAQYHEYAVTSQNHERLKRFCIAYEYTQCIRWVLRKGGVHAANMPAQTCHAHDTPAILLFMQL